MLLLHCGLHRMIIKRAMFVLFCRNDEWTPIELRRFVHFESFVRGLPRPLGAFPETTQAVASACGLSIHENRGGDAALLNGGRRASEDEADLAGSQRDARDGRMVIRPCNHGKAHGKEVEIFLGLEANVCRIMAAICGGNSERGSA